MQAEEHDILIWDSEIRRPRICSGRKLQAPRRAAFIVDDSLSRANHQDEDESRLTE